MRKVSSPFWTRLLAVALLAIVGVAFVPTVHAADADDEHPEKVEAKPEPGFWEAHSLFTEIVGFPLLLLMLAGAMASNTTTERITTEHWDWWGGKPLAKSYTYITVPQTPASPGEIKTTLIVISIIYLALRFTCGFGFINVLWQIIGGFADLLFSLFTSPKT